MYKEDIAGSMAHAKMLARHGIISEEDCRKITEGLKKIKKEIDDGNFDFSVELEDIHMNVESGSPMTSAMPAPGSIRPEAGMTSVPWTSICT